MDDDHLPDFRRDRLGPQIDYVDVFAEEMPKQPKYTGRQMLLFGLILGFVLAVVFLMYGLKIDRPMWVGPIPVPSVHDWQVKQKTGNWPERTQKILDGEIKRPS